MATQYKNILVIQTAFIGDVILASSLVEKLHVFFPQAKVSVLVRKGNESVFDQHPFLNEVLVWNKTSGKTKHLFKLLLKIRNNRYDCVINCHRYASSGFLAGFSGAIHIAGYKQNPFSFLFNHAVKHSVGNGLHETERYNQLVEDFTDRQVMKPRIYPSESDLKFVKTYQERPYVCIAPASVWFTKQLPEEKWIELCNQIGSEKSIYLLGGSSDLSLCEVIKTASKHSHIQNLAGKLSLLQSAALIKSATMNYVNDSAPLHLASATTAPVTAFFCSTVPEFGFGPLSDRSFVFGYDQLACRPCGLHGFKNCPLGHFNCGHLLDISGASGFNYDSN
jgi:heptosyltransferase-2